MARRGILLQRKQAGHLGGEEIGVGAVVGEDDAGVRNRQAAVPEIVEHRHARPDRVGNVSSAEQLRIVEAIDEVDEAERHPPLEAERLAKTLALVDMLLAVAGHPALPPDE